MFLLCWALEVFGNSKSAQFVPNDSHMRLFDLSDMLLTTIPRPCCLHVWFVHSNFLQRLGSRTSIGETFASSFPWIAILLLRHARCPSGSARWTQTLGCRSVISATGKHAVLTAQARIKHDRHGTSSSYYLYSNAGRAENTRPDRQIYHSIPTNLIALAEPLEPFSQRQVDDQTSGRGMCILDSIGCAPEGAR